MKGAYIAIGCAFIAIGAATAAQGKKADDVNKAKNAKISGMLMIIFSLVVLALYIHFNGPVM